MLSDRKYFLRMTETLCASVGTLCLGGALLAKVRPATAPSLELFVYAALAAMMGVAITVAILTSEFARVLHASRAEAKMPDAFSPMQVGLLVNWSPAAQGFGAVLAMLLLIGTALVSGSVQWSSGEPFTPHLAVAAFLYVGGFYFVVLPVLGSASRMPGSFEDNAVFMKKGDG
ncbi:MAG: hypothetical protein ABI790_10575 [Betaproteobacteria bacterium]